MRMKRRHLTTMTFFLFPLFCCDALLAQGDGDYNGDGYVDLDDFAYWGACMTGPGGGLAEPDCAAFDFDSDIDVDLLDFGGFMAAFTGPSPCTIGRKYTHVTKSASATGCSAKIRTRSTTLCGEPSQQSLASSIAWVGVTKFVGEDPQIWAQMGYRRLRSTGSTTILLHRYAETRWGSGVGEKDYFTETGVPSGTHEYKCYLLSSLFGTWKYEYDGLPFHTFTHNNWRNVTGTHYQYETEIFNKEDQMVGTAAAKCNYTECKYSVNWGTFQNANITSGDLHTDDPSEWGIERVSSTAFNVWDKNP
jgi:hypothetical protein